MLLIAALTISIITLGIISLYFQIKLKVSALTRNVCKEKIYSVTTGDIVLMQYNSSGLSLYKGFENVPLHCGIIYVKNNIPFVIEATNFQTPSLQNYFNTQRKTGVRIVLLEELVNSVDNFICVRKLIMGKFNIEQLENELNIWALNFEFDNKISNDMNILDFVALGFYPLYPKFCSFLSNLIKFNEISDAKLFCSEFITRLLQKLGHINKNFRDHRLISPLSLISTTNTLENLSYNCANPLKWSKEFTLVCKNGVD